MQTLKLTPNEEHTGHFRAMLKGCTSFREADKRLAAEGVDSGGKRRLLIAKHAPTLYNREMGQPYMGR
jgi:hypothetical protein